MKYKLAVCMPAYNAQSFIGRSIKSILTQSFKEFIFIITDDCSVDDTSQIIESFNDPRILLFKNEKNKGTISTRNNMLNYCLEQGFEYMAIMDADDIAFSDRFEKQIKILNEDPSIAVCGSSMEIERTGGVWLAPKEPDQIKGECLFGNPIPTSSATIRLRYMRQFNLSWDKEFWPCADYHLWYKMLYIHNLRTKNTGDVDMIYSYSPNGVSHGQGLEQQEKQDARIKQLIFQLFDIQANDDDAFSFTKVVLYRSNDPAHAEGFLAITKQILKNNTDRIIDETVLRRSVSHRASTYLKKTKGISRETKKEIQDALILRYYYFIAGLEFLLIKIKEIFFDYYFPNISRELVKIYFRLRKAITNF